MNSIKAQIEKSVKENLIDFLSNSINSVYFINVFIRSKVEVSEEQEEEIVILLYECQKDWLSAGSNPEGANKRQQREMNKIENNCAKAISNLF